MKIEGRAALGVGAGVEELEFTTENTKDTPQRVLPTMAVVIGMGGFGRPILHGLCTYGFTGRALLHSVCGSDPARFKSMKARFSKPVMPGDCLDVSMWVDGSQRLFQTRNQDGELVFDQGVLAFE